MGWRIILEVGGFALGRKDLKPDAFRTFDLSKPQKDRKKSSKSGDCEGFKSVPLVTKSSQELPSSDLRHLQRHSGRLLARKSWSTQEFEFSEVNLHTYFLYISRKRPEFKKGNDPPPYGPTEREGPEHARTTEILKWGKQLTNL